MDALRLSKQLIGLDKAIGGRPFMEQDRPAVGFPHFGTQTVLGQRRIFGAVA